jgi:predicted peroxiredoxin
VNPYLLIETRSSWESAEVGDFLDVAGRLNEHGHPVDLFLIQNGVLLARTGAHPQLAALLSQPGLRIWADDFSMASRSLQPAELLDGIRAAGIGTLVDLLTRTSVKAIWH